jgi:hypothetical protein
MPDEAFAAVIDIARWGEWTDMRDIRPDGSGSPAVGSTGTFALSGPFSGPIRYELTALEPNHRVEYHLTHPSFDWRAEVIVEPVGAGARMVSAGEFRLVGWRRLLEPIVAREIRRGEAAELVRLKAILEASQAAAPAAAEA